MVPSQGLMGHFWTEVGSCQPSGQDCQGSQKLQGCPTFWRHWATLEEELLWSTHSIHCDTSEKKSHNVLSEFTIFCSSAFTAVLGCTRATGWTPLYLGQICSAPVFFSVLSCTRPHRS